MRKTLDSCTTCIFTRAFVNFGKGIYTQNWLNCDLAFEKKNQANLSIDL